MSLLESGDEHESAESGWSEYWHYLPKYKSDAEQFYSGPMMRLF